LNWLNDPVSTPDELAAKHAQARQAQLTKPTGALGDLETIAIRLAAMQNTLFPKIEQAWVTVFAADHGLAESGVSAFPQAVTAQMVSNFLNEGAAISVLARQHHATLEVVDVGVKAALTAKPGLLDFKIAHGTANCLQQPAMTTQQLSQALDAGKMAVERAQQHGADIFIGGEMGIGNTAIASLLLTAMLERPLAELTGAGTGLDEQGVTRKIKILQQVLAVHQSTVQTAKPLEILRCLGGFEVAALVGSYIRAAQLKLPVLVDGVITTAAALMAANIAPSAKDWWLFSHQSAEPAHPFALQAMQAKPLLDLGMRLGEGSGAAVALPLLQQACWLHNQMATFAEAQVSEKHD